MATAQPDYKYWNFVSHEASMGLQEDVPLEDIPSLTLSIETNTSPESDPPMELLRLNPTLLFRLAESLTPRERDIFVSACILRKTQTHLAQIHGSTQTGISTIIRTVMAKMAAMVYMEATPSKEDIESCLDEMELEWLDELITPQDRYYDGTPTHVPSSELIFELLTKRDYREFASRNELTVTQTRQSIRSIRDPLLDSSEIFPHALGILIEAAYREAFDTATGKQTPDVWMVPDSKSLGDFTLDIKSEDWSQRWTPQGDLTNDYLSPFGKDK